MEAKIPHTEFGRKLRAELKRQDVSVRELARRLNPSDPEGQRTNVTRWLSPLAQRAKNPSPVSRRAAAVALGLDPSAFDDEEESELPLSRDETVLFFELVRKIGGGVAVPT